MRVLGWLGNFFYFNLAQALIGEFFVKKRGAAEPGDSATPEGETPNPTTGGRVMEGAVEGLSRKRTRPDRRGVRPSRQSTPPG